MFLSYTLSDSEKRLVRSEEGVYKLPNAFTD